MQPHVIRGGPLSVLIALADPSFDVAPILPALRPHYALVCATPAQAVETANQFEPDVVLIDFRMPDPWALARRLAQAAGVGNIVFVAMSNAAGPAPTGFQYHLPVPATASDLENLLWQIGRIGARHAVQPGTEMIG